MNCVGTDVGVIVGSGVRVFSGGSATVSAGASVKGDCAFEAALNSVRPEQDTRTYADNRMPNMQPGLLNIIEGNLRILMNYNKAGGFPCDSVKSDLPLNHILSLTRL